MNKNERPAIEYEENKILKKKTNRQEKTNRLAFIQLQSVIWLKPVPIIPE